MSYSKEIELLLKIIKSSNRIVFFGGAGVSTESNIPDFRSVDGLYNLKYKYPPEEIISHSFFVEKPEEFYEFYKDKLIIEGAKPNITHNTLKKLEDMGKLSAIVTQNIDGLHEMAGSKKIYNLHGTIYKNHCTKCHKFFDVDYIKNSKGIPYCDECGAIIKPDVVLYEEPLDDNVVDGAINAIHQADTLIVGGTSLVVYPAAGLLNYYRGNNLILINKDATSYDNEASLVFHNKLGDIFSIIDKEICSER